MRSAHSRMSLLSVVNIHTLQLFSAWSAMGALDACRETNPEWALWRRLASGKIIERVSRPVLMPVPMQMAWGRVQVPGLPSGPQVSPQRQVPGSHRSDTAPY